MGSWNKKLFTSLLYRVVVSRFLHPSNLGNTRVHPPKLCDLEQKPQMYLSPFFFSDNIKISFFSPLICHLSPVKLHAIFILLPFFQIERGWVGEITHAVTASISVVHRIIQESASQPLKLGQGTQGAFTIKRIQCNLALLYIFFYLTLKTYIRKGF